MMRALRGRGPDGTDGSAGSVGGAEAGAVAALESRPVAHGDRTCAREALELDPLRHQPDRRLPPADAHATQHDADALRTRGDLTRPRPRRVAACDSRVARTCPL